MSNTRFRYELTTDGEIEVYQGNEYLATCKSFGEVIRVVMYGK